VIYPKQSSKKGQLTRYQQGTEQKSAEDKGKTRVGVLNLIINNKRKKTMVNLSNNVRIIVVTDNLTFFYSFLFYLYVVPLFFIELCKFIISTMTTVSTLLGRMNAEVPKNT
jgi:hypothetical protein